MYVVIKAYMATVYRIGLVLWILRTLQINYHMMTAIALNPLTQSDTFVHIRTEGFQIFIP